jgi:hypothetical protein
MCHVPGGCQDPSASDGENSGLACCVPGTDKPVSTAVCGQCDSKSNRDADAAVYCSCRCGEPEGVAEDPDADYCTCPAGFECSEVVKFVGIGDPKNTGKFCIKQGSAFDGNSTCGQVKGYFSASECQGIGFGDPM